jgi:hypothetical protein
MSPEATLDPRQQYDALASALSTRRSTLHFAHAAVSSVVVLILSGTAGRLFYKGDASDQQLAMAVAGLAVALLIYGVARVVIGRGLLKRELADYAKLQVLRAQLGLDDPKRLMP